MDLWLVISAVLGRAHGCPRAIDELKRQLPEVCFGIFVMPFVAARGLGGLLSFVPCIAVCALDVVAYFVVLLFNSLAHYELSFTGRL